MKRSWAVLLLSLWLPLTASAQEAPPAQQGWTLDGCLRYARENSPRIRAAREAVKAAAGQRLMLVSEFMPRLYWNNTYTRNSLAPLGTFGSAFSSITSSLPPSLYSQDFYDSAVSVSATLFSFRMYPTFKGARANVKRASADLKRALNDLTLDVKKAYFGALFAKENLRITQAAEAVAKENYDTSENLYREGKNSHFDVSRAKVEWINSKTERIAAQNRFRIALEALRTVLSLPKEQALEVGGSFPEEVAEEDLDGLLSRALRDRPELEELRQMKTAGESGVQTARGGYFPSLNAAYTYTWEGVRPVADSGDYYKTWTALATLSIPIFDGSMSRGRLASAKAELEEVRASWEGETEGIVLEVRQAYFSLDDARERLAAQKENVETAKENLRIAQERYALGLLPQLDLKDAELSLIQAETQKALALFDYNIARSALDRAVGLPERASD
jgi:outer membrane protein